MARTEILHFPSVDTHYLKEFDANVVEAVPDHIILDKTPFYAETDGQAIVILHVALSRKRGKGEVQAFTRVQG
jgi:alanyl-tRNA synthetase